MRMYIGITDKDWFEIVKKEKCEEVNFWKPGNANFKVLKENDIFLFKLHAPYDYIVGGGYFVHFSFLPIHLAWQAFGIKNGIHSLNEFNNRIIKYRNKNGMPMDNPQIGCIILAEPFYFADEDWISVPEDWKSSIVQGKQYSIDTAIGMKLYKQIEERINRNVVNRRLESHIERYTEGITKHRLGQGAFRVAVIEAYQRRCAIKRHYLFWRQLILGHMQRGGRILSIMDYC